MKLRAAAAAAARSRQSCLTLCDPTDSSLPSSSVPGIVQARTLEWVAISFFSAWKWKVKVKSESEKWKWSRSVVSGSERPRGLQPTRLLHPWDFPGRSTGVSCHCLLHKSHWPSNSDHWGFPVPLPDPQAAKPDVGPRTFTKVEELLWYYRSPDCGSPAQQVWDLIWLWLYPSYSSLGLLLCPWTWGIIFWWVPVSSWWWMFSS